MMLVVQFALAYYARTVLSGAAQDGAAVAARRDATLEEGRRWAEDLVGQAGSSLLRSSVASGSGDGDRVTITIEGEVVSLIPFRDTITVRASGSAPVETFRPQEHGR